MISNIVRLMCERVRIRIKQKENAYLLLLSSCSETYFSNFFLFSSEGNSCSNEIARVLHEKDEVYLRNFR